MLKAIVLIIVFYLLIRAGYDILFDFIFRNKK